MDDVQHILSTGNYLLCRPIFRYRSSALFHNMSLSYTASCVEFGNSGSGIVRKWKTGIDDNEDQYSFVGPLSMSKGCDRAFFFPFGYRGQNPAVATDATCFMDWVADQYNMELVNPNKKKSSCFNGKGDREDKDKKVCKTSAGTLCNFSAIVDGLIVDRCELFQPVEGIANNVNKCIDNNGAVANCPNNCIGVDPNSIIGAGVAAVTLSSLGALSVVGPLLGFGALGVGAVGAAGVGGAMLANSRSCGPPFMCRVCIAFISFFQFSSWEKITFFICACCRLETSAALSF